MLHQLGAGSLGPVFRGDDPGRGVQVAIKSLNVDVPPDRCRHVADALAELAARLPQDPAIVAPIDVGIHDLAPYIVWPLVQGTTLDVALREFGPAAAADALPRLAILAQALDRAAANDVWHGALHPRDIMVSDDDTLLLGLGVAPVLERFGVRCPARRPYTSPEQIEGHPSSPRADQFALAAIAHEWLFGRRIAGPADGSLSVPQLPGVNRQSMADAFSVGLAVDPDARFPSAAGFVEALERSITDRHEAGIESLTRAAQRRTKHPADAPVLPLEPVRFETFDAEDDPLDHPIEIAPEAELPLVGDLQRDRLTMDPVDDDSMFISEAPVPVVDVTLPRDAAAEWRGLPGVAADYTPEPSRGAFGAGAVVGALLLGLMLGIAAGYGLALRQQASAVAIDADAASASGIPGGPESAAPGAGADQPATGEAPLASTPPPVEVAEVPILGEPVASAPAAAPAPPPAPEELPGRLLIRSTPSGAQVRVDGDLRGTTPLTLRGLRLGTHIVIVTGEGSQPSEHRIALTEARPSRSLDVELTAAVAAPAPRPAAPATATGSLSVESRPAGAAVRIDDRDVGTTPLTMPALAPGSYRVTIARDGYQTWTTTVRVVAGERARVAASLVGGRFEE